MRMKTWPAAKYLTYSFWRSWILVVYTAPIWSYIANPAQAEACSFGMYVWSTIAFSLLTALIALFHRRTARLLANRFVMCASGVAASLGMVMEYAGAYLADASSPLFAAGALLTGVGTAFIAVRAGQIYASTRPVVAVTNTALSELASGLVFFFVVGTVPAIALLVAAVLPLAAALMTLFDRDGATESSAERPDAQLDAATRRASVGAFARFLVIVALFTFVASLTKGMFALQDAQASLASGELGVSLVILVSFGLVLLSSLRSSFNFGAVYYPLVLMLAVALVIAFSSSVGSEPAAAVIVLVYCLFSLFMWCLLAYLARSDYWSPVQVFGWGRSVFALGSLAGLVTGERYPQLGIADSQTLVVGLVLAFLLVAASMLIFRESDVRKIINAGWLAADRTIAEADAAAAAIPASPANVSEDARLDGEGVVDAESFAADHNLTMREREVFLLMLRGRDARSIGEALVISDNTAKAHIRSIYAKTGVHTRQEFVDVTEHIVR